MVIISCLYTTPIINYLSQLRAYKAIIRPHLEYASRSWNRYTSRNINKIEAVQRRSVRFVLGNYKVYSPTSGLTHDTHQRLKWIPLQHRRALYDLALFYKIRSNMVNTNFPPIVGPTTILATARQIRPRPDTPLRCLQVQFL